jgi:DNA-binding PadR family transcriptional regulator
MDVSRVEVVVLGLLAEEPVYGYELLERVRDRGMAYWSEVAKASVYQALRRLENGGAITSRVQGGADGPDRRVYRIAASGRSRLRRGLIERLSGPPTHQSEATVALGFVHHLSTTDARKTLSAHESAAKQRLADIRAERVRISDMRGPGNGLAVRVLEQQEILAKADLAWLGTFRKNVGRIAR